MSSRRQRASQVEWRSATPEERLKVVSLAVGAWQSAEAGVKLLQSNQPFERDVFLYRLVMTGVAVTYARPFGANDGIASLPHELRKFDDVGLREQHEELLLTRRKLYGHTDGNHRWDVESLPFGTQICFRRDGEGKTEVVPVVPTPDISPSSLPTIARLVEIQIHRVLDLMAELIGKMLVSGGKTYNVGQTYTVGEDFP
jgi:hypothetical protein